MMWYLASRFGRKDELLGYKEQLEALGETVRARWLTEETDMNLTSEEGRIQIAIMDAEDVTKADGLIAFSEDPDVESPGNNRGGRHVELGLGIALNKRVVVIGPRENVFMYLPNIEVFPDFGTFIEEGL